MCVCVCVCVCVYVYISLVTIHYITNTWDILSTGILFFIFFFLFLFLEEEGKRYISTFVLGFLFFSFFWVGGVKVEK